MRLRYAGSCRSCATDVAAGELAVYFKGARQIECLPCHDGGPSPVGFLGGVSAAASPDAVAVDPTSTDGPGHADEKPVDIGVGGASARREHERRAAKREERIRAAHPRIGGFPMAVTDEPQSTRAWDVGARGEEQLAKRLNGLVEKGVLVLHDRRIPGSKANIDHIAISAAGVFVIDAKRYRGRPTLKVEGGILRPRTETLMIGRRDCTKLLAGIAKQVDLVKAALATMPEPEQVPVRGMLCFIDADWPLFGGAFVTEGVDVLWPGKAAGKLLASGSLVAEQAEVVHRHLALTFPVA